MILLTVDEIISIHSKLIEKTGGLNGLRDRGLLESAVASADNSFEDIEKYPTVCEKSARLAYAIITNHAFLDGNKRIGILTMLMTLKLNNIKISYSQKELINLGLAVADNRADYSNILNWLNGHSC